VHPRYKTKHRVGNWASYDRSLVERGCITLWLSPDAIAAWTPGPTGRRGGPRKFSDLAIESALTLRLVFQLPLRQAEGFLQSLLGLMELDLEAPDHTTLSRRSRDLRVGLRPRKTSEPRHLIVDSTGLTIMGEGEWAAAKHGGNGKRGWRKLHLGVDATGVIVAQLVTDGNADDAAAVPNLLEQIDGQISLFVADAAYDTRPVYRALDTRRATVVVPPTKAAVRGRRKRRRCSGRDRTITRVRAVGRRRWKKEAGYHRQARVENAFFRYKTILGGRLRARDPAAQVVEARVACDILNRMTELGTPESFAVGR
jgi:IS5 family transposase